MFVFCKEIELFKVPGGLVTGVNDIINKGGET